MEQAWAISLPEGFPILAVAAEHMAMILCVIMAHGAQLAERKEWTEHEWQKRKDAWAQSLTAHADCMAVIYAASREASLRARRFRSTQRSGQT